VIVAVVAMRVMEVAVHQVIDMIAVRHRRMAAIGTVLMILIVAAAGMLRRAGVRVLRRDGESVLLDLVPLHVVQVAVMQVINVVLVDNAGMTAIRAVLMGMSFVMVCHGISFA
jgi:hypothetical protein